MDSARSSTYLSLEEYQRLEEETDQRYEYHDGKVFAMAGGDPKHNVISVNTIIALGNQLADENCTVFNSDQKVRITAANRSLYPDISVVCGTMERDQEDTRAITNPVLLIEVLSDSTSSYDQGDKFKIYSRLPSLREYILVSQHEPSVQTYYRASPSKLWQMTWTEGLDQLELVRSLALEIPLRKLYLKTEGL